MDTEFVPLQGDIPIAIGSVAAESVYDQETYSACRTNGNFENVYR